MKENNSLLMNAGSVVSVRTQEKKKKKTFNGMPFPCLLVFECGALLRIIASIHSSQTTAK